MLPVAVIGDYLTLAVSNPYDVVLLDDLKLHVGKTVLPVVSTDRAINKAIENSYHAQDKAIEDFLGGLEDDGEIQVQERGERDEDDDEGSGDLGSRKPARAHLRSRWST